MPYSVWISFLSYTVVTALAPGPNNILALSVSGNVGMKQSKNILLGIYAGFFCIMALCGAFSAVLMEILPNAMIYEIHRSRLYSLAGVPRCNKQAC